MRKYLLSQKQIDFYDKLQWQSKKKRIRKKARKIINHDANKRFAIRIDEDKGDGTNEKSQDGQ